MERYDDVETDSTVTPTAMQARGLVQNAFADVDEEEENESDDEGLTAASTEHARPSYPSHPPYPSPEADREFSTSPQAKKPRRTQLTIDLSASRQPVVKRAAIAAGLKVFKPSKKDKAAQKAYPAYPPRPGTVSDEISRGRQETNSFFNPMDDSYIGSRLRTQTTEGILSEGVYEEPPPPPALPPIDIVWSEMSVSVEKVTQSAASEMLINHFPGMDQIGRKVPLVKNINRLAKLLPAYCDIMPLGFTEFSDFSKHRQSLVKAPKRKKTVQKPYYIVKPNGGCMGKGIYLTSNPSTSCFEGTVVQEYLADPLLIENKKFDLRCYVLILSVSPPRIFFYNEGLLRLCSENFESVDDSNSRTLCMHLSNYSVNKRHKEFVVGDGDIGGKRNFAFLSKFLEERGEDSAAFWQRVHKMVVKSVFAILPSLSTSFNVATANNPSEDGFSCFELLGFDVLVDSKLQPLLCEVNHSPSLVTDTPFDAALKQSMLTEAFKLISLSRKGKIRPLTTKPLVDAAKKGENGEQEAMCISLGLKKMRKKALKRREVAEAAVLEGFVRVYPSEDPDMQAECRALLYDVVGCMGVAKKRPGSAATTHPIKRAAVPKQKRSEPSMVSPARKKKTDKTMGSGSPKRRKSGGTALRKPDPLCCRSKSANAGKVGGGGGGGGPPSPPMKPLKFVEGDVGVRSPPPRGQCAPANQHRPSVRETPPLSSGLRTRSNLNIAHPSSSLRSATKVYAPSVVPQRARRLSGFA